MTYFYTFLIIKLWSGFTFFFWKQISSWKCVFYKGSMEQKLKKTNFITRTTLLVIVHVETVTVLFFDTSESFPAKVFTFCLRERILSWICEFFLANIFFWWYILVPSSTDDSACNILCSLSWPCWPNLFLIKKLSFH